MMIVNNFAFSALDVNPFTDPFKYFISFIASYSIVTILFLYYSYPPCLYINLHLYLYTPQLV